jgi:hypothetical protein
MSLEYKDLVGLMKPTVFIDSFSSKMGDPQDVCVLSFFVRDQEAATDLMRWFEKGYDWILDADVSPGEISPGRYLVYVELRRRSSLPQNTWQLLSDLNTLTEFNTDDWTAVYRRKEFPFDREEFEERVPTTPNQYLEKFEKLGELNEMRQAAGLPVKSFYDKTDPELQALRAAAGF